jgi:cell wall-associated NlpC family hydrolase
MAASLRLIALALVLTYSLVFGPGSAFAASKKAIGSRVFRFKVQGTPWLGAKRVSASEPIGLRAVGFAKRFIGVPYVWGGSSPTGFDCSGLVRYVYQRFGISLPHSSYADFDLGRRVGRWALEPGDLVFFDGVGHVGLYIGNGRFIHAPHTGTHVQISTMSSYGGSFDGARRVVAGAKRRLLRG